MLICLLNIDRDWVEARETRSLSYSYNFRLWLHGCWFWNQTESCGVRVCTTWFLRNILVWFIMYKGFLNWKIFHCPFQFFLIYLFDSVWSAYGCSILILACSNYGSWPLTSRSMWNHVWWACVFYWWGFLRDRGEAKMEGKI